MKTGTRKKCDGIIITTVPLLLSLLSLSLLIGCGGPKAKVHQPTAKKNTRAKKPDSPTVARKEPRQVPHRPAYEPEPAAKAQTAPQPARVEPTLRVGILTNSTRVTVSCEAKFYVQPKAPEALRSSLSGEVTLALESGSEARPQAATQIFRVQVASMPKEADAQVLQRKLEREFSEPVVVQFSPQTKTYRVRIGEFTRRAEAFELAAELRTEGYRDALVVQDQDIIGAEPAQLRIALRAKNAQLLETSSQGFLFFPASEQAFLKVNGKAYRGILDALINRNGKITVVNELNMEAYLRGVVPNELPPKSFPELEALKAQAIAARTYAIRHLGQFQSDGFDLLATERSQVYNGVGSEQDLSTRAVVETHGLAIHYNNEPISALYTSTCGGRTENFENMFNGKPVPYLRSVVCAPDLAASGMAKGEGRGAPGEIRAQNGKRMNGRDANGNALSHELAILASLGVLKEKSVSEEYMAAEPDDAEVEQWVARVCQLTKRRPYSPDHLAELDLGLLGDFAIYLADTIFGKDASDRMLSSADAYYYLANFQDAGEIPEAAKKKLALLIRKNILLPYPDNTLRPQKPISRRTALGMFYRTLENLSGIPMASGTILRANAKEIQVKNSHRTLDLRLADDLYLFQRIGKELVATPSLHVVGGEEARYYANGNEVRYLEVKLSRNGVANDRFSQFSQWEVSLTAEELTQKLKPSLALGKVVDLQPIKFGASQRVIELKVIGTRGEFTLKGLKIRSALGLRDNLFTIDREYAPSGEVRKFIFSGRGWGHGVGLCQTGAYGMALAGEKFDTILKKYYTGVEIKKIY